MGDQEGLLIISLSHINDHQLDHTLGRVVTLEVLSKLENKMFNW